MTNRENVESYPLKSLHEFLTELDREWERFRTASIIGIITSGALLFLLVTRLLGLIQRIRRTGWVGVVNDFVFLILVGFFVIYEISLLVGQYQFFKKWERRIGLLLHLEETLLGSEE